MKPVQTQEKSINRLEPSRNHKKKTRKKNCKNFKTSVLFSCSFSPENAVKVSRKWRLSFFYFRVFRVADLFLHRHFNGGRSVEGPRNQSNKNPVKLNFSSLESSAIHWKPKNWTDWEIVPGFYLVLLGFHAVSVVSLKIGFIGCSISLNGFLLVFTEFYWVSSSFNGFS